MGAPMRFQPQGRAAVLSQWLAKGLKLAYVPGMAFVNAVDGKRDNQHSGTPVIGLSTAGLTYGGGARAEFPVTADANKGLTIISIWRSRASSQYLSGDGTPNLVSSRTSGNAGWSYSRTVAVGGATNGNLTGQSLTFQGVAQYTEANNTIESLVDTPVAVRYSKATGKISWFRFGQKSSPDTTAGSPSAGGNLVFGAQGDYGSNGSPWIDRTSVCLVFEGALSDDDIHALTSTANSVWQVFDAGSSGSAYESAIVSTAAAPTSATAALAWTEANDGSAITANETDRDTIAWTEADDASVVAGTITDRAALSWAEPDDAYAALVTETDRETFAWTEPDDVWALTAAAIDRAALAWIEDDDAETLTVSDASPVNVSGSIAWAEQDDALSLVGGMPIAGTLGWVETDDGIRITATSAASALLDTHDGGPVTRESLKAAKRRAKDLERARVERDARAAADRNELREAISRAAKPIPVAAAVPAQEVVTRPTPPRVEFDEDEEELLLLLM